MTDAEKAIRDALADPALFDEGASVDDTFRAADNFGAACNPAAIRALLAAHDALKADAERYRWLRANRQFCAAAYPVGEWAIPAGMVFLGPDNPDADSWIDAAKEQA